MIIHYQLRLAATATIKSDEARIKAIRKHCSHFSVKTILQLNFDPRIELGLPKGKIRGVRYSLKPYTLDRAKKFVMLLPEIAKCDSRLQSEKLFLQLLQCLSKKDGLVVNLAKDHALHKYLSFRNLTQELFFEAFPALRPDKFELHKV